jgi:hypothetical protein
MKSSKQEQYKDLSAMTHYSFSSLKNLIAVKQGQVITEIKLNGTTVPLVAKTAISYKTKIDSKLPFRIKETIFSQEVLFTIEKGKQYGKVTVWKNGVEIGSTPLIAAISTGDVARSSE